MNSRLNPIDKHVGMRVRRARMFRDMSQQQLAVSLGIPAHALKKYEAGFERIGADILYSICRIFEVRPSFFFENMQVKAPVLTFVPEAEARPQMFAAGGGFAVVASQNSAKDSSLAGRMDVASAYPVKARTVVGDVVKKRAHIALAHKDELNSLIAAKANDSGDRRVAERRSFRVEVAVLHKGRRRPTMVDNISLTGIKLADQFGFLSGETVQIDLGGAWIAGKVVWTGKGSAGLQFERPLPKLPPQIAA